MRNSTLCALALAALAAAPLHSTAASNARRVRYHAASAVADAEVLHGLRQVRSYDDIGNLLGTTASMMAMPASSEKVMSIVPGSDAIGAGTAAFYAKGNYYVINSDYDWGTYSYKTTVNVYSCDTWKLVATFAPEDVQISSAVCYNPADGYAYALGMDENYQTVLNKISLTDFTVTKVADIKDFNSAVALVADGKGSLYSTDVNTYHIYKINAADGAVTDLGELAEDIENAVQGICYDERTSTIYHVTPTWHGYSQLNAIHMGDSITVDSVKVFDAGTNINGLYITTPADAAPDAVSNLAVSYNDEANPLNCTLSFNVPATTYGGSQLTGDVQAVIDIDHVSETTPVEAGKAFSVTRQLTNGPHIITVALKNDAGTSRERMLQTVAGYDQPDSVRNVNYSVTNGTALVTWDAPTKSKNGGSFDASLLTYDVLRTPGNVKVGDNLTSTQFTEQLPKAYHNYGYLIVPKMKGTAGDTTATKTIDYGEYLEPPFSTNFTDNNVPYTLYNSNGAGWVNNGEMFCISSKVMDDNYSFITQAIHLQKGVAYRVAFDAKQNGTDLSNPSKLLVTLGTAGTPDAQTTQLMDTLTLVNEEKQNFSNDFTVPADGYYYLGIRSIAAKGNNGTQLDNLSLAASATAQAPAAVTALKATAADKGALQATLHFNAPATTVAGDKLSALSGVQILNADNTVLQQIDNVQPGQALSYTDTGATNGFNTYHVLALDANGISGMATQTRVYVGEDLPGAGASFNAAADGNTVKLTWQAPADKGALGAYVNPANVKYSITAEPEPASYNSETVADGIADLHAEQQLALLDCQQQARRIYTITPSNSVGEGTPATAIGTVGTAYILPYSETFAGNAVQHAPFTLMGKTLFDDATNYWHLVNGQTGAIKPAVADGGFMQFTNGTIAAGTADAISPIISLKNASRPVMSLWFWHGSDADEGDAHMKVLVSADDKPAVEVADIDYNDYETEGWKLHHIDLSKFAGSNVVVYFRAITADATTTLDVDNIKVYDQKDNDLEAASLDVPQRLTQDSAATVKVTVVNNGTRAADKYTVALLVNGRQVAQQNSTAALSVDAQQTYTFTYKPAAAVAFSKAKVAGAVSYAADELAANDTTSAVEVFVNDKKLPVVTDLKGTTTANSVVLSWTAPAAEQKQPATDNFDSYTAFTISGFGNYQTIDGDGSQTYYPDVLGNYTAYYQQPQAWQVFNYTASKVENPSYQAHSGDQYLVSFSAVQTMWGLPVSTQNDNWLISPQVEPATDVNVWLKAATISSTYGPEKFQVLYTTGDALDTAQYKLLATDSLTTQEWRNFSYTLPADARYFAIRNVTPTRGAAIMLDDLTFTAADAATRELTPAGYRVYCDGELVAETNDCSATVARTDVQSHTYTVTTLWTPDGESRFSNAYVSADPTAIRGITAGSNAQAVYGVNGVRRSAIARGINIVTLGNGRTVKVLKK